jgi:hypothetical protein
MVKKKIVQWVLMERYKERWQRGRPRSKLENNNKKALRALGLGLDTSVSR